MKARVTGLREHPAMRFWVVACSQNHRQEQGFLCTVQSPAVVLVCIELLCENM